MNRWIACYLKGRNTLVGSSWLLSLVTALAPCHHPTEKSCRNRRCPDVLYGLPPSTHSLIPASICISRCSTIRAKRCIDELMTWHLRHRLQIWRMPRCYSEYSECQPSRPFQSSFQIHDSGGPNSRIQEERKLNDVLEMIVCHWRPPPTGIQEKVGRHEQHFGINSDTRRHSWDSVDTDSMERRQYSQ